MAHQPPISPDSRKKKPALPFLLSNIRNAHSAIASSVAGTSEARPLVGGSTTSNNEISSSYAPDRSNMKRSVAASLSSSNRPSSTLDTAPNTRLNTNPAPASLSSTLTSIQQRFEDSWRKRNKHLHKEDDSLRPYTKKRRQIRVSIPQSFLLASVCFFLAIPVVVLLYVLAKKSVFGDEGVEMSEHKYEVKTFDGDLSAKKQQTVLGDLETEFQDVQHAAPAGTLDLIDDETAGVEHEQQIDEDKSSNLELSDANQEETNGSSELKHGNISEQKDSYLRGYQQSNLKDSEQELISVDVDGEIVESDPEVGAPENIQIEPDESSGFIGDESDAALSDIKSVDNDEDSV